MVVLYVFIGIISFIIGVYLLILTIRFLIEGTEYFKLANKKLRLELGIREEILENKMVKEN